MDRGQILAAFFKSRRHSLSTQNGHQAQTFEYGCYRVVTTQTYGNQSARTSTGRVEIFQTASEPIWSMEYRGECTQTFARFLNEALAETTRLKQFLGGRGPVEFKAGDLIYRNAVTKIGPKEPNFTGREEIYCKNDLVAWHDYWGKNLWYQPKPPQIPPPAPP